MSRQPGEATSCSSPVKRPDRFSSVTGTSRPGTVGEETALTLSNLAEIATAAGGLLRAAVKVTVYLARIEDFADFDEVYGDFFASDPPARTTVAAG